jgi:hypothetical protein
VVFARPRIHIVPAQSAPADLASPALRRPSAWLQRWSSIGYSTMSRLFSVLLHVYAAAAFLVIVPIVCGKLAVSTAIADVPGSGKTPTL